MGKNAWYPMPTYLFRRHLIFKLIKGRMEQGSQVLEIGYGSGDMLLHYARNAGMVYGYDFSPLARHNAEERIEAEGRNNIRLLDSRDDLSKLCDLDFLISCEVLEHVEKDMEELCFWSDRIRRGGFLILSVPAHRKKWGVSDVWAGHYRRYEKEELEQKITLAGLKILKRWSYPFPFNLVLSPLLNRATGRMLKQQEGQTMEAHSKESGITRSSNPVYRILSHPAIMAFLYPIQDLFLHCDLGSGYIVLAQKQ